MSGLPYPPTSLSEGGGLGGLSTIKCLMSKTTCRLAECTLYIVHVHARRTMGPSAPPNQSIES